MPMRAMQIADVHFAFVSARDEKCSPRANSIITRPKWDPNKRSFWSAPLGAKWAPVCRALNWRRRKQTNPRVASSLWSFGRFVASAFHAIHPMQWGSELGEGPQSREASERERENKRPALMSNELESQ